MVPLHPRVLDATMNAIITQPLHRSTPVASLDKAPGDPPLMLAHRRNTSVQDSQLLNSARQSADL